MRCEKIVLESTFGVRGDCLEKHQAGSRRLSWDSTKPVREDCLGGAPFMCEEIVLKSTFGVRGDCLEKDQDGSRRLSWGSTKPVREDCLWGAPFLCEVIVCEGALWGARQFLGGVGQRCAS